MSANISSPSYFGQRRALLIGSPVKPLRGPAIDLGVMEALLSSYGFTCTKCFVDTTHPATRKGILDAWEVLIEQTSPADAVVVYYSGHGGLTTAGFPAGDANTRRLQYIVPLDFGETRPDDWRGIADFELSDLLVKTTKKTRNVTIILDCCHSARLARGPNVNKTIDMHLYDKVYAYIEKMIKDRRFRDFNPEGNRDVVTIAAAYTAEPAYETRFTSGKTMGVLTEALNEALRASKGAKISWRSIMRRMRDRISLICPEQNPQVEGPQMRIPFSLDTVKLDPWISIVPAEVREQTIVQARLNGGRLHDVGVDDIWAVMPYQEESVVEEKKIADATIVQVGPLESRAKLKWKNGYKTLPQGAKAFPFKKALDRFPVGVQGTKTFEAICKKHLQESKFVRAAEAGDQTPNLAKIIQTDSDLSVQDYHHFLLRKFDYVNGDFKRRILEFILALESRASAKRLLEIEDDSGPQPPSSSIEVELGLVVNGKPKPFDGRNITLPEGQRLYVSIKNIGPTKVFVFLFDVVADYVVLLSNREPTGTELEKEQSYCYGKLDFTGELVGFPIGWPPEIPRCKSIPETLLIVVTNNKIDLRSLERTSGLERGEVKGPGSRTKFADLINWIYLGGPRMNLPERQHYDYLRFGLRRLSCDLKALPPQPSKENT